MLSIQSKGIEPSLTANKTARNKNIQKNEIETNQDPKTLAANSPIVSKAISNNIKAGICFGSRKQAIEHTDKTDMQIKMDDKIKADCEKILSKANSIYTYAEKINKDTDKVVMDSIDTNFANVKDDKGNVLKEIRTKYHGGGNNGFRYFFDLAESDIEGINRRYTRTNSEGCKVITEDLDDESSNIFIYDRHGNLSEYIIEPNGYSYDPEENPTSTLFKFKDGELVSYIEDLETFNQNTYTQKITFENKKVTSFEKN